MESVASATEKIAAAIRRLAGEGVPIGEAWGRYLASPLRAERPVPPFTCSAMDGYAVRAADVVPPTRLSVGRTLYAGDAAGPPLGSLEAARIFTGAPLPPLADAVVAQERVDREGNQVLVHRRVAVGENVRRAGEDVEPGEVALESGTRLFARQLGLCAALGVARVEGVLRPRVALLSTGDEIESGRVPDSNSRALVGALESLGARVTARTVADDEGALALAFEEALEAADLVVSTGGVSVGERDLVPRAIGRIGAAIRVHGVALKPGKPFLFAIRQGKPLFGLPGSPSACLVAFEVFARPAVLAMAGAARVRRRALRLPLAEPLEGRPGRARFVWARLDSEGRVRPLGPDIAQIRGPALAEALIALPADEKALGAGAAVECWLLEEAAP
jgi:molybdopterin molybdotransferase